LISISLHVSMLLLLLLLIISIIRIHWISHSWLLFLLLLLQVWILSILILVWVLFVLVRISSVWLTILRLWNVHFTHSESVRLVWTWLHIHISIPVSISTALFSLIYLLRINSCYHLRIIYLRRSLKISTICWHIVQTTEIKFKEKWYNLLLTFKCLLVLLIDLFGYAPIISSVFKECITFVALCALFLR